jgi:2-aminoadipate transaminase
MRFAARMDGVRPSAIRDLLRLGDDPALISFGGGYPDPALFPVTELRAAFDQTLAAAGRGVLQYTTSDGLPALRSVVAERMAADGTPAAADDILILHGSQQGFDLVAKMFIDGGDLVVTENPTFLGALIAFNPFQPRYLAIDGDDDGLDTAALETALRAGARPRFVYVVPDFANPTGTTLSLPRRRHLLELAREFDFLVLEDSPYRALRYEGTALPTLHSLDTDGRVIHLGSFSKVLAPGLRMGWAAAEPELLDRMTLLKMAADTQSSTLNMAVTARLLGDFDLDGHIATLRNVYRHKRDLMLATMRDAFPASVTFTEPAGGLFTWATFPAGFDAAAFMTDRVLPEAKIAYVPGGTFFPVREQPNHARFSYSGVPDDRLVDGIHRLGRLFTVELDGLTA